MSSDAAPRCLCMMPSATYEVDPLDIFARERRALPATGRRGEDRRRDAEQPSTATSTDMANSLCELCEDILDVAVAEGLAWLSRSGGVPIIAWII